MSRDAPTGEVRAFLREHFRHFNSGELVRAADAYAMLIERGGSMMVSLAGALSTAEIGIGLAEMIRRHKVHAICCTGANLEEDVFRLLTRDDYRAVPDYRELSAGDERALHEQGLNRVADTCIPEETIRVIGDLLLPRWREAASRNQRAFPHEYLIQVVMDPYVQSRLRCGARTSWVHAAAEQSVPIFVPGWEDSTLGNLFTARVIDGTIPSGAVIRSGSEYLAELVGWYRSRARL